MPRSSSPLHRSQARVSELTTTYLDRIVAGHRAAAASDERRTDDLVAAALAVPAPRGFRTAIAGSTGMAIISEVKRRSPSKGDLYPGLDPAELAHRYAGGGATCLSVLTDADWFGGSVADLKAARDAVQLPTLRKDFTVHRHDVLDARIMGADCVLLIASALDDTELAEFHALAMEVGLDVLVEVHDEAELDRALAIDADLIGVNQRDLVTFEVDTGRALRMAPRMPAGVVRVAESGVGGADDVAELGAGGFHAVLVGETLLTHGDPGRGVQELRAGYPG